MANPPLTLNINGTISGSNESAKRDSLSLLKDGHFSGQGQSTISVRTRAHRSTVGFGQGACDVELPSRRAHPLAILDRPLEQMRELLMAELRASVLDLDYDLAPTEKRAQNDLAAFGALDAVAEQIGHDTFEM